MTTATKPPMIDQGFAAQGIRKQPRKTHCSKGHERTPDNLGRGNECLKCKRAWNQVKSAQRAAHRAHELAVAGIRHQANVAGRDRLIAARRARGVPMDGWQVDE